MRKVVARRRIAWRAISLRSCARDRLLGHFEDYPGIRSRQWHRAGAVEVGAETLRYYLKALGGVYAARDDWRCL